MSENFSATFREVGSERIDPAIIEVAINKYMKDYPGSGSVTEEQINDIVVSYLQSHPIQGGVSTEEVNAAISNYLQNNPVVGVKGDTGKSAYQIACDNGFSGTQAEWLASLEGQNGDNGKSAYEVAVELGFEGTVEEWEQNIVKKDTLADIKLDPYTTVTGKFYATLPKITGENFTATALSNDTVDVAKEDNEGWKGVFFRIKVEPNNNNDVTINLSNINGLNEAIWASLFISDEYCTSITNISEVGGGVTISENEQNKAININITPVMLDKYGLLNNTTICIGITTNKICSYNVGVVNTYGDDETIGDIKETVDRLKTGKFLSGKRVLFFGDSITAFKNAQSWVNKFVKITGCTSVANVAVSGAVLNDYSDTVLDGTPSSSLQHNNTLSNQVIKVLEADYSDIDLIIIAIGTNSGISATDNSISSTWAISELDEIDRTTHVGSFRWANEKLHNKYPNAVICWCSPIYKAGVDVLDIMNWHYALEKLTLASGVVNIPTIRCGLERCDCVANTATTYFVDGLHPTELGARKIAKYNANAMSQLFVCD